MHPKPFHRASLFTQGHRIPLDTDQRAIIRSQLDLHRRPGGLTQASRSVGRVLLDCTGTDGRCDPAYETIAILARVSRSSVCRALDQLEAMGFLLRERRLVRVSGWQCRQTSNSYALRPLPKPVAAVIASSLNKKPTSVSFWNSQRTTPGERQPMGVILNDPLPFPIDLAAAQAALAARRAVVEARLAART